MLISEIDRIFEEASKVLHLDASHDAIRTKVQGAISAAHRKDNAAADSASYYNTPYVRDVFGTEDAGQVVHQKDGKMTLSHYKLNKDGGYDLANHKPVKQAYVVQGDAKQESMVMVLDGKEMVVSEAATELAETCEAIEFQEAKSGAAKITLISAGTGAMGHYTEAALKKAAKDGIFSEGTQMFLNHQTKEERKARPEGDITKLAGVLTAKAEYVEGMGGKPGRLVAPAKVFGQYKDFISEAKEDIGVSVRVMAIPNGVKDGVPLVESILGAISADFVTKAGRGGKIEEMYESYRASGRGNQPQEQAMTDEEKKLFTELQESNRKLAVRLDRAEEQNAQILAESHINKALATTGLKPRGQERVKKSVLATLPTTGALDVVKLEEAIKVAIKDEVEYLKENGVQTEPRTVRGLGIVPPTNAEGKELSEAEQLAAADKIMEESVGSLIGRKEKTA